MPANLYGSTKLCAEKLFIAGNAYSDGKTKFSVVRYGNVVGSRGSIIEKLVKHEGTHTVTITDERMTRFWIDLEKASSIVLFGLEHMEGGEVFIPKAATMRLTDLFDIVVPEAKRTVIGIRPGEKLHETLLTKEEARHAVDFRDYFVILPEHASEDVARAMKKYEREGTVLPEDFSFESDGTENEMSREELLRIVETIRNPL
jgi:UDP-N-acetylglucosamine 4,6-dehydratase